MKTVFFLCIAASLSLGVRAETSEFPLVVREMDLKQAQACPGGYGNYTQLTLQKPSQLVKMPRLTSQRSLYAEYSSGRAGGHKMVAVFDESNGTGKGYDRMIADLNGNGDLTDDPVTTGSPVKLESSSPDYQIVNFGPVNLPAGQKVGQWQPRFFVQLMVYSRELQRALESRSKSPYFGQARAFAGNYLEAQVEVGGARQKFGIVDGDCDFDIGKGAELTSVTRDPGSQREWYLGERDWFLRDVNGSGKFERTQLETEAEPFSSIVYFGGKLFTAALAPGLESIRFSPYTGEVGEVQFQDAVRQPIVAWEKKPNEWDALAVPLRNGKGVLPVGEYRLASFVLVTNTTTAQRTCVACSEVQTKSFTIKAGKSTALPYGQPLALKLSGKTVLGTISSSGVWQALKQSVGKSSAVQMCQLELTVQGVAGEKYSSYFRTSGQDYNRPEKAKFVVLGPDGKQLATGEFEFG